MEEQFAGSPVLCSGVKHPFVLVKYEFVGLFEHVALPPFDSHNPIFFGVLEHPPDVLVVVEVVPEGEVAVGVTEGCPDEFDGSVVSFELVVLHDIQHQFIFAGFIMPSVNHCVLSVFNILDCRVITVLIILLFSGRCACVSA